MKNAKNKEEFLNFSIFSLFFKDLKSESHDIDLRFIFSPSKNFANVSSTYRLLGNTTPLYLHLSLGNKVEYLKIL